MILLGKKVMPRRLFLFTDILLLASERQQTQHQQIGQLIDARLMSQATSPSRQMFHCEERLVVARIGGGHR